MARPTSAYGNGPENLSGPSDYEAQMAQLVASAPTPQMRAPAAQPQAAAVAPPSGGDYESAMAQLMGQQAPPDQAAQSLNTLAQSMGEVVPATPDVGGGAPLSAQFKASFAGNDTEKLNFVKKLYGEGNAIYEDGKIKFSTDGGKTYKPFNSKVFGNFLDNFIPSGRELVKEGALLGPELLGGAGGAALAGPAAPGGAILGATAARVGFTPQVNRLADSVAQWIGIPQDAGRNKDMENDIEKSIESMLPVVGAVGKKAVNQVAKRMPGTKANLERKTIEAAKDVFTLNAESKQIVDDVKALEDAGLTPELLNNQIHTQSAPLQSAASKLAGNKEFQDAQIRVADNAKRVITDTAAKIYDEKLAMKASDGRIGDVVTNAAKDLQTSEGRAIGQYKAKAMAATKNKPLPLTNDLRLTMQELGQKLGFTVQSTPDGRIAAVMPKNPKLGTLGITERGQMSSIINTMNDFAKASSVGDSMRLSDIERLTTQVGNMNRTAQKVGGELNALWGRMSSQLRDFRRQAISSGLDEIDKKGFNEAMDKFGTIKQGVDNIVDTINSDMGSHIVVDKLLSKGKEGLGDAKALKYILKENNPAAWEKLKGDWMTRQLELHAGKNATGVNAGAFLKDINTKYGQEFMSELFDDPKQLEQFKASLRIGQRINDTTLKPGKVEAGEAQKIMNETTTSLLGSAFLKGRALVRMFGIGKDADEKNALMKVLTQDGYNQYIRGLPPKQKAIVTQKFDDIIDYAIRNNFIRPQTIDTVKRRAAAGAGALQDVLGRQGTQRIRTEMGTSGGQPAEYDAELEKYE